MGLKSKLSKMKSFLFDEEDEEERPIKKRPEEKKKKIENLEQTKEISIKNAPAIEELYMEDESDKININDYVGSRTEKKESEFKFPEFDDDDFLVNSKKPEPIVPVAKEEPKRILYQGSKRRDEVKKFKPSPIISPIYGLIDQNGNVNNDGLKTPESSRTDDEVRYEQIRKKAYGIMDKELENTITRLSKKTIEEAEKEALENEKLSRVVKNSDVSEIEVSEVVNSDDDTEDDDMILPSVNFKEIDVDKERGKVTENNIKRAEMEIDPSDDDDEDDTKEQDLFNLIDTMYQEKENEE